MAIVMQSIGIELVALPEPNAVYQSVPQVIYDTRWASRRVEKVSHPRWGMRVPLGYMEECISVWPDSQASNNDLRGSFEDGMDAVDEDSVKLVFHAQGTSYTLNTNETKEGSKRLESSDNRAASMFLPKMTYSSAKKFGAMLRTWGSHDQASFNAFIKKVSSPDTILGLGQQISQEALAQLQAFLLGFYYKLLLPLVDVSTLSKPEAFGSWGYEDVSFLKHVLKFLAGGKAFHRLQVSRPRLLCFLAYMFAGADVETIEAPVAERVDCIGILAKLSLLTWACLGSLKSQDEAGKFHLLDTDTTFIPSTSRGVVTEGIGRALEAMSVVSECTDAAQATAACFTNQQTDFTAHIEPDWDNDVQSCVIAYRHRGRLIHRLPPSLLEAGSLVLPLEKVHNTAPSNEGKELVRYLTAFRIDGSHGGRIVRPYDDEAGLLIYTYGLPQAKTCILGMYAAFFKARKSDDRAFRFLHVASPDELNEALQAGMKYLIAGEHVGAQPSHPSASNENISIFNFECY
ncbi:hypothetical protein MMC10_003535 [Thelotrema lepadinum]|nr:hypothetical protein [Thelotrema lepadinum]